MSGKSESKRVRIQVKFDATITPENAREYIKTVKECYRGNWKVFLNKIELIGSLNQCVACLLEEDDFQTAQEAVDWAYKCLIENPKDFQKEEEMFGEMKHFYFQWVELLIHQNKRLTDPKNDLEKEISNFFKKCKKHLEPKPELFFKIINESVKQLRLNNCNAAAFQISGLAHQYFLTFFADQKKQLNKHVLRQIGFFYLVNRIVYECLETDAEKRSKYFKKCMHEIAEKLGKKIFTQVLESYETALSALNIPASSKVEVKAETKAVPGSGQKARRAAHKKRMREQQQTISNAVQNSQPVANTPITASPPNKKNEFKASENTVTIVNDSTLEQRRRGFNEFYDKTFRSVRSVDQAISLELLQKNAEELSKLVAEAEALKKADGFPKVFYKKQSDQNKFAEKVNKTLEECEIATVRIFYRWYCLQDKLYGQLVKPYKDLDVTGLEKLCSNLQVLYSKIVATTKLLGEFLPKNYRLWEDFFNLQVRLDKRLENLKFELNLEEDDPEKETKSELVPATAKQEPKPANDQAISIKALIKQRSQQVARSQTPPPSKIQDDLPAPRLRRCSM